MYCSPVFNTVTIFFESLCLSANDPNLTWTGLIESKSDVKKSFVDSTNVGISYAKKHLNVEKNVCKIREQGLFVINPKK